MAEAATAVAMRDEAPAPAPLSETAAILQVIERAALNPNVDIDKMERLLQMQERVMARTAKAAYAAAFAEMQPKIPSIPERGQGHGTIRYALWEDINDIIKPVLAEFGFGLSFRVGRTPDRLTVTGILSHREGHSEETTIELPADTSGSKNSVQAVGSSTSYGKRYAAQALLNLTSRGEDDDGVAAGAGDTINDEQFETLQALIDETDTDVTRFCAAMKLDAVAKLPASAFATALAKLEAKKKQRGAR